MGRLHSVMWCALAAVAVAGCGGGGGSSGGDSSTGEATIAITDAPSDQLETFTVDITSIELRSLAGALVSVLPATTRVDLAELVTVSELLAAGTLPAGAYTSVVLSMDVSQAHVVIGGNATPARLTDVDGSTLTGVVQREVQFASGRPMLVAPGLNRFVEIDVDLDSSCVIDAAANTVQLQPVISASAAPSAPKPTRLYGTLSAVDSATNTFTVQLKPPFVTATRPAVTVSVTGATTFELDGAPGTFADLAARPLGSTPVLCRGAVNAQTRAFAATSVTSWTAEDAATGIVVARTDTGTLTLRGASVELSSGQTLVNQQVTVSAQGAAVLRRGAGAALTVDDIGVGQRVIARGTVSGSTLDATVQGGHVTLLETGMFGYATGAPTGGLLEVDVARFGGRPVADLDFVVGGGPSADPTKFLVSVAGLNLPTVVAGTPVAIRGQVAAWNAAAGQPDAFADSVSDRTDAASLLYVDWLLPTGNPFVTASSSGVSLRLPGTVHRFIDQGLVSAVRFATSDQPTVVPSSAQGLFLIIDAGVVTPFDDFADWQAEVAARLAGTRRVRAFAALGKWDAAATTLTARQVTVLLE